jgi:hypothetical protein
MRCFHAQECLLRFPKYRLVIYSPAKTAHRENLKEVLDRLRRAGFTLNKDEGYKASQSKP